MFLKCENTMSKGCSSPEILIKIIFHIHEVHHRLLMERAHSHWWYSGEHCCLVVTCFLALAYLCLRATLLVQPATHKPGGEKRIHAEFPGMFVDKPQRYSMILFILYQCWMMLMGKREEKHRKTQKVTCSQKKQRSRLSTIHSCN